MTTRPRIRAGLRLALVLAGVFPALLAGACSSEEENASPAGSDAGLPVDGLDATSDDAVATGDAAVAPDAGPPTPLEACRAYVQAACDRRAECGLGGAGCMSAADLCPDVYLSPGSPRTAESLFACASVRRTQPCAEVIANVTPSCAPPGTRDAGEPCSFVSQCASFACSGFGNGICGKCLPVRPPGTGCPGIDETCGYNMRCVSAEAGCAPITVSTTLSEGAACAIGDAGSSACPADAPCASPTPGAATGTCTKPPSSGPCIFRVGTTTSLCAPSTVCFGDAGAATCVGAGNLGEPCAPGARGCIDTLRCDATSHTCQPLGQVNDPCASSLECAASLYCTPGVGGKCAPRALAGQPCSAFDGGSPPQCVSGATCQGFSADSGLPPSCVARARLGDECSFPFAACVSPLVCSAGHCALAPCPADAGTD